MSAANTAPNGALSDLIHTIETSQIADRAVAREQATGLKGGGLLARAGKGDGAASCFDSARRLFAEVGSPQYQKKAAEHLSPRAEERSAIQRLTARQRLSSLISISQDMSPILNLDELLEHVMAKAIEHNDLDCVQLAMNPARAARFEDLALPAANKKNLGVILMKVTGQDKLMVEGGAAAESSIAARIVVM